MPSYQLYETLELSQSCSDADIRSAYKRLSLLHHPDRTGNGDPARFQQIQHAYEVLSDPTQRSDYDEFGDEGAKGGFRRGPTFDDDDEADLEDLFGAFFDMGFGGPPPGAGAGGPRRGPRRAHPSPPSNVTVDVTLEELYSGVTKKVGLERTRKCKSCEGSGALPHARKRKCYKCEGQGVTYSLRQMGPYMARTPVECGECEGSGEKYRSSDTCRKCKGACVTQEKVRHFEIEVPAGASVTDKLVYKGEGDELKGSSRAGDLLVTVRTAPHPTFRLAPSGASSARAADLHTTVSMTLSEALLGCERVVLRTLDGRALRLKLPAPGQAGWRVLQTGDEVTIKGEGMRRSGAQPGDLRCRIEVEQPGPRWADALGAEQVKALETLLPPKRPDLSHQGQTDDVKVDRIMSSAKTQQGTQYEASSSSQPDNASSTSGSYGCPVQ